MPTESDLHDLLHGVAPTDLSPLNARTVIARSKRRRLPRQLGMGGVVALSAVGITTAGIQGFGSLNAPSGISAENSTIDDGGTSPDSGVDATSGAISRAPAEKLNLCGAIVADIEAGNSGLILTSEFPDARVGSEFVTGTVTVTNRSAERVVAMSAANPTITLSQDGIVVWHSVDTQKRPTIVIDLAPGESREFSSAFNPVVCSTEDDLSTGRSADLPAATAGRYDVSAALDVTLETSGILELVTGPRSTIELR